jgi:hypothetical protein
MSSALELTVAISTQAKVTWNIVTEYKQSSICSIQADNK